MGIRSNQLDDVSAVDLLEDGYFPELLFSNPPAAKLSFPGYFLPTNCRLKHSPIDTMA